MLNWILMPALALALAASPLWAGQVMVGVGVFTLVEDGVDLQLSYRPERSHFMYGYKYTRWTDRFDDPFTGRGLTKTTSTLTGPTVSYLFRPEWRGTAYLGVSLLRWSKTERSLITGEAGSDSTTAPFFGGGFTGRMGEYFYYNVGLFLSPGAKLSTKTSVSSEEDSGGFDVQLHLGMAF
jgi:hypothetical protein